MKEFDTGNTPVVDMAVVDTVEHKVDMVAEDAADKRWLAALDMTAVVYTLLLCSHRCYCCCYSVSCRRQG